MATFYGSIVGNRGVATRMGSKSSGFRSSCQSYDGSVITSMYYLDDDKLHVRIGTSDYSSSTMSGDNDFAGTFEEFKELLVLAKQIRRGEVSIVHHRPTKQAKKLDLAK